MQGEIGRTLAMTKINEIKIALAEVKENFEKESANAASNALESGDDAFPVYSLV